MQILKPFPNDVELKKIVASCHDLIWAKQGHDPAKAFDELLKLLFIKVYDERENPTQPEFLVEHDESIFKVAGRIRRLFDKAKLSGRYRDIYTSKFVKPEDFAVELDDFTVYKCTQMLQQYSLEKTTVDIKGIDIKGMVFEEMVGLTFRGGLGQFFTPRSLARFMVQMLNPRPSDKIIDPACGSGGFLILSIEHIKRKIAEEMSDAKEDDRQSVTEDFLKSGIFGIDINDRMVRVAKMNMVMHGDGHGNILNANALDASMPGTEQTLRDVKYGTFDIVFSNPPFAGVETDPSILGQYELGVRNGRPRSVTKEVLFIELIVRLLKDGGKAALVLPQGVFNDKKLTFVRGYLKRHARILALIELPLWAFQPSGTSVAGNLLFLEKVGDPPSDYEIFVKKANHIGYDSTGKPSKNNLDEVLQDFLGVPKQREWIQFQELDTGMGYTDTGRIDPKFYTVDARRKLRVFENSLFPLKRLDEVAEFSKERFNPRGDSHEFLYVEINDVDVASGQIQKEYRKGDEITQNTVKVHTGQILVGRRRPYRGAIAVISEEFEGALAVSEFSALTVDSKCAVQEYLLYVLKSRQFLDVMDVYTTGEMSNRISEEDLRRIKIPMPSLPVQKKIAKEIRKLDHKTRRLRDTLGLIERQKLDRLNQFLGLKSVSEVKRATKVFYRRG